MISRKNIYLLLFISLVLFFNHCIPDLPLTKQKLKTLQLLLYLYPDLTIEKSTNSLQEGNITTIRVKLNSQPSNPVRIPVSVDSNLIQTTSSEFIFDSSNWDTYQSLQIFAPDDPYYEENQNVLFNFGPYQSSDFFYNGKLKQSEIFYLNNDPFGLYTSITNPQEGGPDGILSIYLQSKPKGNVTIYITNPSPSDLNFSPSTLMFTPSNWNTPQNITITAIDDTLLEYNENFIINLTASSSDKYYKNYNYQVPITVFDNDVPGFNISPNTFNLTEGNSQNINIKLNTYPENNVNVFISANPPSLCTISSGSSLTFTSVNYNTYQTFTVQAKPLDNIDNITESPGNCTITIIANSSDPSYNGLTRNITGTIIDYLNAGIILTNTNLGTLLENGPSTTFTIRLTSEPSSNVIVCFKSSNYCEATVSNLGLNPPDGTCTPIAGINTPYFVFNNTNWNSNKNISIMSRHDWVFRSTPTEDGSTCSPPYPDGTKPFIIQIFTYCSGCNANETPYYNTNTSPYSVAPYGQVQDDLDLFTFVTSPHDGNFNGDSGLSGSNAIEKADNFCAIDNPGSPGTYKALLVDGINRSACGNGLDYPECNGKRDWVLKANKYYFRYTDGQLLFKTDNNPFFVFWDPDAQGIPSDVWTGIAMPNWADSISNCVGWDNNSNLSTGSKGNANTNTPLAISGLLPESCDTSYKLLCIQQ